MDLNKNYYNILGVLNTSDKKDIKKSYYKLSFDLHPDRNSNIDIKEFQIISEAYSVLSDDKLKSEYDRKSKFGKDYNEIEEFFKIDMEYNHTSTKKSYERFKDREILDIIINIDNAEDFDGSIEYPRFISCKKCGGTGKDTTSKIIIRDENGNIKATFDADDGCDFCDGTGKNKDDENCTFCNGHGKIGMKECQTCNGDRRILGKQKLNGIKLDGEETKVEAMGHISYYDRGKTGHLIIKINN